ncbi:hypothetical protein, partial [Neisseria gonorrhoeae]|uniref:hypothetical protein n=1 Tax=Neisseria gonorrhoeae TaxID=485 RepID=UPI001E570E7C
KASGAAVTTASFAPYLRQGKKKQSQRGGTKFLKKCVCGLCEGFRDRLPSLLNLIFFFVESENYKFPAYLFQCRAKSVFIAVIFTG